MNICDLIKEAELNMVFMSGSGLGSNLLAGVAIAVVWRSNPSRTLSAVSNPIAKFRNPNK